jgi:hypothetical protein
MPLSKEAMILARIRAKLRTIEGIKSSGPSGITPPDRIGGMLKEMGISRKDLR